MRKARGLALSSLALLAACGGGHRTYHDSQMDFGSVKTVAVLPFANLTREQGAAERVREVFANSLLATGTVYVLPTGEVLRGTSRTALSSATTPAVEEVVWAQEEPKNQGAWTYVQPRLRASAGAAVGVRYVGRPERASPAEGFADAHQAEQARIVAMVMDTGEVPEGRPAMTATH